jgi:hypothetical protein
MRDLHLVRRESSNRYLIIIESRARRVAKRYIRKNIVD